MMRNSKSINLLKWSFMILVNMILSGSCNEGKRTALISIVKTVNINGGAIVSYKVSNSDSIAYVLAKYMINDNVMREVQSSPKNQNITLDGFGGSGDHTVHLYTMSRSNELSDPIAVMIHPKTPPYRMVRSLLKIEPDFGGINIKFDNHLKKHIGITLLTYDSLNQTVSVKDQRFFKAENGDYTVREFLPGIQQIGVYVSDLYGNHSDTIICKMSVKAERLLDKSKFKIYPLPSDTENGYNWFLPYLWDGHTDGNSSGWHTNPTTKLPILCTFDLGIVTALSHFVMWERPEEYCYKAGNPKDFSIWGTSSQTPRDTPIPVTSTVGTIAGDWINLGNYHYPDPPSGAKPGSTGAADNAFVKDGVSFNIALKGHQIRMVRVAIANTWSGLNYAHIMELSFYGEGSGISNHSIPE
jgi:hypothetical protein